MAKHSKYGQCPGVKDSNYCEDCSYPYCVEELDGYDDRADRLKKRDRTIHKRKQRIEKQKD